jgi:hypothetical protein
VKVVPPIEITDANLVSSTAVEPMSGSPSTESVYNSAATYGLGAEVISTVYHRKYESLQAANVGKPLPVPPETETDWWLDIGPTNKWAMFDLERNTQTDSASPLTVVISLGTNRPNSIGLLKIEGTSVSISLNSAIGSPAVNYYQHSESLSFRDVRNWYDYFFEAFTTKTEVAKFDLPPYLNTYLTITITNTAGNAKCGGIVIGTAEEIGEVQRDAQFDLVQFSVIERDTFGNATLIPRRSIPTKEHRIRIEAVNVDAVIEVLVAVDAVPALWSAIDDSDNVLFKPLLTLGIYRNARFRLADPDCELTLKLEEI